MFLTFSILLLEVARRHTVQSGHFAVECVLFHVKELILILFAYFQLSSYRAEIYNIFEHLFNIKLFFSIQKFVRFEM